MIKYTFVFEFRAGTYISQVMAESVAEAIRHWAAQIDINDIKFMGPAGKEELMGSEDLLDPVLINGMDNVWCISGVLKSGFFIANIIAS